MNPHGKGRTRALRSRTHVVSDTGRRSTALVALFRLASAGLTLLTLVGIAHLVGDAYAGVEITADRFPAPLATAALAALVAFLEIFWGDSAARREEKHVRHRLLARLFSMPPLADAESDDSATKLVGMMTDSVERMTEYRQVYLGSTLAALAIPLMTLGYVAVAIDPVTGLGVMALYPLVPLLIGGFMRLFRKTSEGSRKERSRLSGRYLDAIRNLETIRLAAAGERIEQELREQGERNRGAVMKLLARNQIVIIVTDGIFSLLLICATAGITIARFDDGALTVGDALAVMLLTVLLIEPLVQVAGFFYIGMGGIAAGRAIRAYLDGAPPEAALPEIAAMSAAGAIDVRDLDFDFGRGPVLQDLELVVPEGGKVAIIGRSGEGKSTLLSLLRGALRQQKGRIAVGGHQLAGLPQEQIRQLTAFVSQSTWLFTGTIADNLRLASAAADESQIWEALRLAQVAEEVERMPLGLFTDVGERGSMLSGGQAQRISLARALLSGRRILLLDEPTSQIDIESENRLVDAIDALGPDWTVLMVTHRHRLLRVADTTYRLADGRLQVEEDTR